MINKISAFNVTTTLDRFEKLLENKGIFVIARVNHAKAANKINLDLRPTQLLIFGNPSLGSPLMQANQLSGLDLPMKILAWEDANCKTWLSYNSPLEITERHDILGHQDITTKLECVIDNLTDQARLALAE